MDRRILILAFCIFLSNGQEIPSSSVVSKVKEKKVVKSLLREKDFFKSKKFVKTHRFRPLITREKFKISYSKKIN